MAIGSTPDAVLDAAERGIGFDVRELGHHKRHRVSRHLDARLEDIPHVTRDSIPLRNIF
jgi:hypothetical protein